MFSCFPWLILTVFKVIYVSIFITIFANQGYAQRISEFNPSNIPPGTEIIYQDGHGNAIGNKTLILPDGLDLKFNGEGATTISEPPSSSDSSHQNGQQSNSKPVQQILSEIPLSLLPKDWSQSSIATEAPSQNLPNARQDVESSNPLQTPKITNNRKKSARLTQIKFEKIPASLLPKDFQESKPPEATTLKSSRADSPKLSDITSEDIPDLLLPEGLMRSTKSTQVTTQRPSRTNSRNRFLRPTRLQFENVPDSLTPEGFDDSTRPTESIAHKPTRVFSRRPYAKPSVFKISDIPDSPLTKEFRAFTKPEDSVTEKLSPTANKPQSPIKAEIKFESVPESFLRKGFRESANPTVAPTLKPRQFGTPTQIKFQEGSDTLLPSGFHESTKPMEVTTKRPFHAPRRNKPVKSRNVQFEAAADSLLPKGFRESTKPSEITETTPRLPETRQIVRKPDNLEFEEIPKSLVPPGWRLLKLEKSSKGSVVVNFDAVLKRVIANRIKAIYLKKILIHTLNRDGGQLGVYTVNKTSVIFDPFTDLIDPELSTTPSTEVRPVFLQWAIAVFVVSLASLLFVILFSCGACCNKPFAKKRQNDRFLDVGGETEKPPLGGYDNLAIDSFYDLEEWKKPVKQETVFYDGNSNCDLTRNYGLEKNDLSNLTMLDNRLDLSNFGSSKQGSSVMEALGLTTQATDNTYKTFSDATCTWSGQLPPRQYKNPTYSCKVFLGGVPWDITEMGLEEAFAPYGQIRIQWPGNDTKHPTYSPKGYVFILFETEKQVKCMLQACTHDCSSDGNWYFRISSRKMPSKEVQVIPWVTADSNFVRCPSQCLDPAKTVFFGALHGMLNAEGLAHLMNDLFGGVVYAGIDTDKYKYPIGSGRVTFNNNNSYMKAVAAAFVEIKTAKFTKKVQVDPYLEDSLCSACSRQQGPYFCRDVTCFKYFCRTCWQWQHAVDSLKHHKPLMRNTKTSVIGQQVNVFGH